MIDLPAHESAAVRSAARRTAWAATTCLAGGVDDRDPLTGDALPRSLGEVLRSARRASASGRNPLPSDGLQQLVEFVLQPLREVIERPRARIERSHAMMPLHRIRDLDATCTEWVGRQPGRTVREKLAGKPSILGVRREFTSETNENILVAKLLRGLLPRVDERLRMVSAGDFDIVDGARHEALLSVQRMCVRALRGSEFGEIDHRKPVRPNNVLLGDRRYVKLWRGWRWLRELDAGEQVRIANAPALFMQALFATTCGEIEQRYGGVHGEQLVRIPSWSPDDAASSAIYGLIHTGSLFEWADLPGAGLVVPPGQGRSKLFIDIAVRGTHLEMSLRRATGEGVLTAVPTSDDRSLHLEFSCPGDADVGGHGFDLRAAGPAGRELSVRADLDGLRQIARFAVEAAIGTAPTTPAVMVPAAIASESCGIDLGFARPVFCGGSTLLTIESGVCSVGFESRSHGLEARRVEWLDCGDGSSVDLFRRGVRFGSVRQLVTDGETLDAETTEGATRALRQLAAELSSSHGISFAKRKAIAIPDSADEFSQRSLRGALAGTFGRTVPFWRTSCVLIGWQSQPGFAAIGVREGDAVMVVDPCSDGLAIAVFSASFDPGLEATVAGSCGIHWQRRPAVTARDVDPRLARDMREVSWRALMLQYAARVVRREHFGRGVSDQALSELRERLVDAGYIERALVRRQTVRVPLGGFGSGHALEIEFDQAHADAVHKQYEQLLIAAVGGLLGHRLVALSRADVQPDPARWHVLLADVPGLDDVRRLLGQGRGASGRALLDHSLWQCGHRQVYAIGQLGFIAARGALELLRRSDQQLPAVADWLPPLSLELIREGSYCRFLLLEDQVVTATSVGTVLSFPVGERLRIPEGAKEVRFLLFEGRAMRQDREVCVTAPGFPLETPLDVTVEVRYRLGEPQPYDIVMRPAADAKASPLQVTIGPAAHRRENAVPSFPAPRPWSDPSVARALEYAERFGGEWIRGLSALAAGSIRIESEDDRTEAEVMFKRIERTCRSIWDDGRRLESADPSIIRRVKASLPLDSLVKLAGCDASALSSLEAVIRDRTSRDLVVRWSRRILGRMHADAEHLLLPIIDREAREHVTAAHVELAGKIAGDGEGERAACMELLGYGVERALESRWSPPLIASSILALGEACWRHEAFVGQFHRQHPQVVERYFEVALDMLERQRQSALDPSTNPFWVKAPQCVRAIGETLLALLRLREADEPPVAVEAGSPLLIALSLKFAEVEAELASFESAVGSSRRSLRLPTYLRFQLNDADREDRQRKLYATSDLAFVLRHYLNGGSRAMIEIVGRSEADEVD